MSSPPKPWESAAGAASAAAATNSGPPPTAAAPAAPTPRASAAALNNMQAPLSAALPASSLAAGLNDPTAISDPSASTALAAQPGSSMLLNQTGSNAMSPYGMQSGYGQGGYGSGYGMNNGYGGGGGGMYGGHPMMNGGMGMMNGMAAGPFGKAQTMMHHMDMGMQRFGRISQLVHMNFDALAMSFSSLLRFIDHAYLLRHEMANVGTTFTTLKFMQLAYGKINRAVRRALGQDVDLADAFNAAGEIPLVRGPDGTMIPDPRGAPETSLGIWGWIIPCLTLAILWSFAKYLWRRLFPPKQLTEEEKMAKVLEEQAANTPQPVIGPDGKPVIGPNGQPLMATPNQLATQQIQMNSGMGMGGMMGGYGSGYGGYGSMGGYGGSMYGSGYGMGSGYGSSMYGGMGGYGVGSSYGGYGSSYGGGYGSSYGSGYGMY